jgi:hypothetical protein
MEPTNAAECKNPLVVPSPGQRGRLAHICVIGLGARPSKRASQHAGVKILDEEPVPLPTKTGPLPVAEYSALPMHSTPGKCWSTGGTTSRG